MSYVGIGTAVGIQMEIPIVLRSLAEYFAPLTADMLPVPFGLDFVNMLELGTDKKDPHRVVGQYLKPWWIGSPWALRMGCITEETLREAINYHRDQRIDSMARPSKSFGIPGTDDTNKAVSLLHALQQTRQTANAFRTSADTDREMIARRAGGFFLLYEAAVAVDTNPPEHNNDADPTNAEASTTVENRGSQWVHGRSLTETEVLELMAGSRTLPRDGYLHTLRTGNLDGDWSTEYGNNAGDSEVGSVLEHSVACEDAPPEAEIPLPSVFNHAKFRSDGWPVPAQHDSASAGLNFRKEEKKGRKKAATLRTKQRRTIQAEIAKDLMNGGPAREEEEESTDDADIIPLPTQK